MRALITGGAGYYGSLLLDKLLKAGYECRIFDLNPLEGYAERVDTILGDIRDYEKVFSACHDVDIVFHNVAQVPLAKDKHLFDTVNLGGTKNVLEAAVTSKVRKLVYTSSSAIYGVPADNPVKENHTPIPDEAYGRAKLKGEQLCLEYIEKGLQVDVIRPRTILGHGRLGIFQILFDWISKGENIPVLGKGDNIYQFVHADDLAEATILAAQRNTSNIFNCGAEEFGTMREVLEYLCQEAGTGSKVVSVPFGPVVLGMKVFSKLGLSPLGAYHSLMYGRSMYFDISKAKAELGWNPKYSNNQMLLESYQWYLDNREQIQASGTSSSPHKSLVKQGAIRLIKWFI